MQDTLSVHGGRVQDTLPGHRGGYKALCLVIGEGAGHSTFSWGRVQVMGARHSACSWGIVQGTLPIHGGVGKALCLWGIVQGTIPIHRVQ